MKEESKHCYNIFVITSDILAHAPDNFSMSEWRYVYLSIAKLFTLNVFISYGNIYIKRIVLFNWFKFEFSQLIGQS